MNASRPMLPAALLAVFISLPDEGVGYTKIFRQRERRYGISRLIETLQNTAKKFRELEPLAERLQVGDLSAKNPGRIKGHKTHDGGLDADIVYLRTQPEEQEPRLENPAISGKWKEDFVRADDSGVTKNFHLGRNLLLIRLLLDDPQSTGVEYILVDQQVLNALAVHAISQGEQKNWEKISKFIRVRPRHRTHLHIRFKQ